MQRIIRERKIDEKEIEEKNSEGENREQEQSSIPVIARIYGVNSAKRIEPPLIPQVSRKQLTPYLTISASKPPHK